MNFSAYTDLIELFRAKASFCRVLLIPGLKSGVMQVVRCPPFFRFGCLLLLQLKRHLKPAPVIQVLESDFLRTSVRGEARKLVLRTAKTRLTPDFSPGRSKRTGSENSKTRLTPDFSPGRSRRTCSENSKTRLTPDFSPG
jgi:hypothetical protein